MTTVMRIITRPFFVLAKTALNQTDVSCRFCAEHNSVEIIVISVTYSYVGFVIYATGRRYFASLAQLHIESALFRCHVPLSTLRISHRAKQTNRYL